MRMSRRLFLGAGLAGAGALTFPRFAHAVPGDVRVVVFFGYGAWDPVLSIDPKKQSDFIDTWSDGMFPSAIEKVGAIDFMASTRRPAVTDFFTKFAATSAVVRGINVGSVAHQASIIRMLTGTRTELSPDFAAIAAAETANDLPLPYTDLGGGAFVGSYAASVGRMGNAKQIITLIDRVGQAYDPAGVAGYNKADIYVPDLAPSSPIVDYVEARAAAVKATRAAAGENAARMDDYLSCFKRADDVRNNPAFKAFKLGANNTTQQIATAVTLLKGDTSRAVFIRGGGGFDSHDNYGVEQNDEQDTFFMNLTALVQQLKDNGLLDKTIVVAASEMGRTPKWNSELLDGKDHWPVTSAVVVGGPVKPGVYGGTDARLNARPVNLKTGKLDANGALIDYDCFIAGLLRMCGLDPAPFLPNVAPLEGFIA